MDVEAATALLVIGKHKSDSMLNLFNFGFYNLCYKLITKGMQLVASSIHNGLSLGALSPMPEH